MNVNTNRPSFYAKIVADITTLNHANIGFFVIWKIWTTRTPDVKPRCKPRCSKSVSSSCSIIDCCITLVKNPMISNKIWKENGMATTTNRTYPWSSVTQIFRNGYQCHDGDHRTFQVMISAYRLGTLGTVGSWLAATIYLF